MQLFLTKTLLSLIYTVLTCYVLLWKTGHKFQVKFDRNWKLITSSIKMLNFDKYGMKLNNNYFSYKEMINEDDLNCILVSAFNMK